MRILCVFGKHNYGNPAQGQGYEYTNFIPALRRLGHEIFLFESFDRTAHGSFADLNRKFIGAVEREKPDLIFCVLMGYELWTETLDMVRQSSHAVIINWATDDSWKFDEFSRFLIPHVHIHATTYPEALEASRRCGFKNVVLTQWAANAATLAPPLPAARCRWTVSFVGMAYGNRPKWVAALRDRRIDVACFGYGWPNGPVAAEKIPEIVRHSVISLNFGDSDWVMKGIRPQRNRQIKARVFEVPGYGGFLMTENANHLERFFNPGEEIVLFDDIDDLAGKIRYFLDHPESRDAIARAGHDRTVREHTYEKRFKHLFDMAEKAKSERSDETTGEKRVPSFDPAEFEHLERLHRPGFFLRLLRSCIVAPCRMIWGDKRGPRAARRILFEVSWRVAGRKTYSASGWPGRIFYNES